MKTKRYFKLVAFILISLFSAALIFSCAEKPAEETAEGAVAPGATILIGTSGPQTGPVSTLGIIQRSMKAYFDAVNADGGINGRKIELIILDDAYDPAKTRANVIKLIEGEKVFAIVGILGAANIGAVIDYIDKSDVPWVGLIAGNRAPATPPRDNVFVGSPEHYFEAKILTNYAANELGVKKIGILYQNDDFGKEGLTGAKEAAERLGIEIAAEVPYEVMDTDFSAHALAMMNSKAEAVILYGHTPKVSLFVKAANGLDYRPIYIGSTTVNDTKMFDLAGEAWDGALVGSYTPDPFDDSEASKWYREALHEYANEADKVVGSMSLKGFYYGDFLVEGLKRTKEPLTRENFIKTMDSFDNVDGLFIHGVTYNPESHGGPNSFCIMKGVYKTRSYIKITDWLSPN
ncbi:MAG: ABC transporter substrate-binding protein [Deltaproteobacteria bacterium]|uniref:ABC transporter substrate-binding protein n=1 Tax=Candidatus Zymogenus saltonus TaxID=2844893 RepID=A0A9D8PN15_9DELT|nr:ABC transporter substrate-binding protein [Candidatus Zymogenus saltonus]